MIHQLLNKLLFLQRVFRKTEKNDTMRKIINPWIGKKGYNCFGCCPKNSAGIHMEFYEDGDEIVSFWKPRTEFQSWTDTLHGGIQSVLLDEICGWVILRKLNTTGVTAKMETKFKKPVDTKDDFVILRAKLIDQKRNIAVIKAELFNANKELCTESICTYVILSHEESIKKMQFNGCKVDAEEVLPFF